MISFIQKGYIFHLQVWRLMMFNKILLLDTSFARDNGLLQSVTSTLRYLVDNRQILLTPVDLNTLFQTKMLSQTPTNVMFEHIYAEGLMDEYALIDSSLSNQSVPELLTISDITVDLKQLANASMVLATLKEYRNKTVINVAPLIKRTREGFVKLTDINELHNEVVRGALVSSYYNCRERLWLNPPLLKYIAQTYSMCISSQLQRLFNLSIPEQLTIAGALTWFIMSRMADDYDELTYQCDYLGGKIAIRQMVERFKETVDDINQFDLVKLANLIALCGPDHMKNFSKDILTRAMSRSGSSYISMHIALEYPPYWVYQVLYALSGNKSYLKEILNKNKLLKSAATFLQDLNTCRQFIPSIAYVTKGQ